MGVAVFIVVCIVRLMSRDLHQFQGEQGGVVEKRGKTKKSPGKFNLPTPPQEKTLARENEEKSEGKVRENCEQRMRNMQII